MKVLYVWGLIVIFGLVVFHAPLTVWMGTAVVPEYDLLVKAWKEILMLALVPLGLYVVWRQQMFRELLRDPLMVAIGVFALWHFILAVFFAPPVLALVSGLMIDLRYLLFFVLVYVAIRVMPAYQRQFLLVGAGAAAASMLFAVLQVFVLPKDFLAVLGYSRDTIATHLYVDNNPDFVRINGTLRGPNPLGVYAMTMLSVVLACALAGKEWMRRRLSVAMVGWLAVGASVALWASYSRSALGAAVVILGLVAVVAFGKRVSLKAWMALGVIVVIVGGGMLFAARDSSFVRNVVLHDDPATGSAVSSNEEHFESLEVGLERKLSQPFGAGPGSTNSASLMTDDPIVIENQYLFVAHEAGWLGLGLFLFIFGDVLWRLWRRRTEWLALGVLGAGVGMAMVGMLQPMFADDTVSIVWWGLAALALAAPLAKKGKHGNTTKQKTT